VPTGGPPKLVGRYSGSLLCFGFRSSTSQPLTPRSSPARFFGCALLRKANGALELAYFARQVGAGGGVDTDL